MNSQRTFTVVICKGGIIETETGHDLAMFTHPGTNADGWQHAAGEVIDVVLDLNVGDSMTLGFRSDAEGTVSCIILRTA